MGSPRSWIMRERATLATLGFSSRTARALMVVSKSASEKSSIGKGSTMFLVTSLRSFGSRHSRSWMDTSVRTACEYARHLVRKYCQPSVVPPARRDLWSADGRGLGSGSLSVDQHMGGQ